MMEGQGRCPVCGEQVQPGKGVTSTQNGQEHTFCCEDCRDKFEQNPQDYASRM